MGSGKGKISTEISKLFMEYYKLAKSCKPVGLSWWITTTAGLQCNLEVHKFHIVLYYTYRHSLLTQLQTYTLPKNNLKIFQIHANFSLMGINMQ